MALRESPRKSKIPLAEMKMVSHSQNKCNLLDIKIDPVIEGLKEELRFVFERIDVFDSLISGV